MKFSPTDIKHLVKSPMNSVRMLVKLILMISIDLQLPNNEKEIIFDFFHQAIFIGLDLSDCVLPFLTFIKDNFQTMAEKTLAYL
jgi:hypothetical protein